MRDWWKAAGIRAIRTCAQTAVGVIGTSVLLNDVNWWAVFSASVLAGAVSILMSIAGLPEVDESKEGSDNDDGSGTEK